MNFLESHTKKIVNFRITKLVKYKSKNIYDTLNQNISFFDV